MKKFFMLFQDSKEIIDNLTDEEAGKLLKAFYSYNETGETPRLERTLQFVFWGFKNQFVRDAEKYEAICERNRQNGKRGGRPKKEENKNPSGFDKNPNNPVGILETQKTEEKEKEEEKQKEEYSSSNEGVYTHVRACETPTLSQVKDVCKAYGFDEQLGEKFYLHYQANGWVQGTGVAIRDWVAQLNKWVADQNKFEKPTANGKPAKYVERNVTDAEFDALFEDLKTVEL